MSSPKNAAATAAATVDLRENIHPLHYHPRADRDYLAGTIIRCTNPECDRRIPYGCFLGGEAAECCLCERYMCGAKTVSWPRRIFSLCSEKQYCFKIVVVDRAPKSAPDAPNDGDVASDDTKAKKDEKSSAPASKKRKTPDFPDNAMNWVSVCRACVAKYRTVIHHAMEASAPLRTGSKLLAKIDEDCFHDELKRILHLRVQQVHDELSEDQRQANTKARAAALEKYRLEAQAIYDQWSAERKAAHDHDGRSCLEPLAKRCKIVESMSKDEGVAFVIEEVKALREEINNDEYLDEDDDNDEENWFQEADDKKAPYDIVKMDVEDDDDVLDEDIEGKACDASSNSGDEDEDPDAPLDSDGEPCSPSVSVEPPVSDSQGGDTPHTPAPRSPVY